MFLEAPKFRCCFWGPILHLVSFLTSPRSVYHPGYLRNLKVPTALLSAPSPSVGSFNIPTNMGDSSSVTTIHFNSAPGSCSSIYFLPAQTFPAVDLIFCRMDSAAASLALSGCCLLLPQEVTPGLSRRQLGSQPGCPWVGTLVPA